MNNYDWTETEYDVGYEDRPCKNDICWFYASDEDTGCDKHSRHYISLCPDYSPLSRDEIIEELEGELCAYRKRIRRICKKIERALK